MLQQSGLCVVHSPSPSEDIAFLQEILSFEADQCAIYVDNENGHLLMLSDTAVVFVETSEPQVDLMELKGDCSRAVQRIFEDSAEYDSRVRVLKDPLKFSTSIPVLALPSGTRILLALDDALRSAKQDFILALQSRPADLDTLFAKQIRAIESEDEPQLDRLFPTLDMKMLNDDGSFIPFRPNAPEPFDVETELFKGRIIVLLRPAFPEREDPYWNERMFSKKRRKIIIQIQGKFKRTPVGTVYAGAEVTDPMKLGFLTKGVSCVLLRLVESFNNNIHYSYGDGEELPHIVGPAYTFFQKLVSTPPGEEPPPIDELIDESDAASLKRRSSITTGSWNTTDTYSFSFYSMYIDLPAWKLVNIPATGDLKLQTFWKDSLLRICMYEAKDGSKRHIHSENRYAFSVQAKFLGIRQIKSLEGDDCNVLPWSKSKDDIVEQVANEYLEESQVFDQMARNTVVEEPDEPELAFFDAEEGDDEDIRFASLHKSSLLLEKIDILCPFWIDRWTAGSSTERNYALNVGLRTVFKTENDCNKLIQAASKPKLNQVLREHFSSRLSLSEKLRRSLGILISNPKQFDIDEARIASFLLSPENQGTEQVMALSVPNLSDDAFQGLEGLVTRAISDRHWAEEWAKISSTGQSLLFFRSSEKKKPRFRLNLRIVSRVDEVDEADRPYVPGVRIIALSSVGRTLYLMVKEGACYDKWFEHLTRACGKFQPMAVDSPDVLRLFEIDSLEDEFMHNSTMWACKNRRLLNSARFYFRQDATKENAEGLSQDALKAAIDAQTFGLDDEEKRQRFLTAVSKLKTVSLIDASEKSKLAFFLNLYHTMITHAFLILGPPGSSLRWINYFNTMSYQVADDIFSISELEHGILRSTSSPPTQFFSRFVIPKSKYHIKVADTFDVRINFALNCGSFSNPPTILIYDSTTLDNQLDTAGTVFLKAVEWKKSSNGYLTLYFPRLIQWYADDFGSNREQRLLCLSQYLPIRVQQEIQKATGYDIRYHAFNFECRSLELLESPIESS